MSASPTQWQADREVLRLFGEAPPGAHLPPAPLGAVRYVLLDGLDHPLGEVYDGRSSADPGTLFLDLCRAERSNLLALLQTRRVQTNDCGQRGAASGRRPIAWVRAEGAGTVDALTAVGAGLSDGPDVLGALLFKAGVGTAQVLAHVHPHGNWIDWSASS